MAESPLKAGCSQDQALAPRCCNRPWARLVEVCPLRFPPSDALSLNDPSLYLDRELSLLAFQHRVLQEAQDPANPLLERVKFLSILFSNIDEFFMVRFAVLKQKAATVQDGSILEQLERIRTAVQRLMGEAYRGLARN